MPAKGKPDMVSADTAVGFRSEIFWIDELLLLRCRSAFPWE